VTQLHSTHPPRKIRVGIP